jgi:hypothetical protein
MARQEFSRIRYLAWMDKEEENSRVRYFVKKCVEVGHMAKPQEPWSPINRGALLPLAIL